MKIAELKQQVYVLAQVDTTQALKRKFKEFNSLDLRKAASWMQVLHFLQARTQTAKVDELQSEVAAAERRWKQEDEKAAALNERLNEGLIELQDMQQDEQSLQHDSQALLDEAEAYLKTLTHRAERKRKASLN
ncbi:hypothetical protein H6F95_02500 [Cyanobacteria bacterium FACHB-471]|nr:hypothetical protein [Cyanobacteria bacterium FACHB-471]